MSTMRKIALLLLFLVRVLVISSADNIIRVQAPIVIVPHVKIFFGPPSPSTSKFPPIIELLVQRLQTQFSSYVYEDLSRPPTYEKPVYTLSPEEQATVTEPLILEESSTQKLNVVEEENTVRPVQYGTLVVYLRNNSTLKSESLFPKVGKNDTVILEGSGTDKSPILTALLDIEMVIPANHTEINKAS